MNPSKLIEKYGPPTVVVVTGDRKDGYYAMALTGRGGYMVDHIGTFGTDVYRNRADVVAMVVAKYPSLPIKRSFR